MPHTKPTQPDKAFAAYLTTLTDADRAAQQTVTAMIDKLARNDTERAKVYREIVRHMLDRIRNGTATKAEIKLMSSIIKTASKQTEPRTNSQHRCAVYTLALYYLAPERPTPIEVAGVLNMDKATVWRDISAGIERVTVLLFGLNAIEWK